MGRKQASELIKLVRGEGGVLWPSRLERRLLKFSLDTFGEMLSQFLLMGLGKQKVGQRWNIAISYIGEGGVTQKRHVQVITYEPASRKSLLPRGRDPLVLLALLCLLMNRRQVKPALLYNLEDVLKLLGWEDTKNARQEIDQAVHRYALLTYQWEMNSTELANQNLSHYKANERIISESETHDCKEGHGGQLTHVSNRVIFNEFFISGLLGRTLFGVEWGKVRSLEAPMKF